MEDVTTPSLKVQGISKYQVRDLASSELQRSNGSLLCLRGGAGIARDNSFQGSGQSIQKHTTIGSL